MYPDLCSLQVTYSDHLVLLLQEDFKPSGPASGLLFLHSSSAEAKRLDQEVTAVI